jgi:hypothetical protein
VLRAVATVMAQAKRRPVWEREPRERGLAKERAMPRALRALASPRQRER